MKVVQYLTDIRLADGGVVRAVLDICTLLANLGHEVVLLTLNPQDVPGSWPSGGGSPRAVTLPGPRGFMGRLAGAALRHAAGAIEGAHVLHLHTPWEPSNPQLAAIARRQGIPYLLSVHGMLDDWSMQQKGAKKRLYLAMKGRDLLERAAFVHCTAQAEMDQSRKWYPKGRARVVPLVFDLAPFRTLPGPDAARRAFPPAAAAGDALKILFLSRVHYKKGLDVLIKAVAELAGEDADPVLLVAGTGEPPYIESMKRLASGLGVAERTHFLGMVVGDVKTSLFQAADVFVLPTSQENWGYAPLEAMACGVPVVTTRGVDIWPELMDSGGALIVDRSAGSVAGAVRSLASSAELRREMGERGRQWVLDQLEPARTARRYESLYQDARAAR